MNSSQIYFFLAAVFLLGLLLRFIYERLKMAGRIDTRNTLIFPLIFTATMLIWASWLVMSPLDPWRFDLPGVIRWSGIAVFILGLILVLSTDNFVRYTISSS